MEARIPGFLWRFGLRVTLGSRVCLNAPIADSRAGLGRSPVGGNLTAVACSVLKHASGGGSSDQCAVVSDSLMPGGGVARRPLHFIIMGDCSGSMKGPKMQALNTALRAMLPHLLRWEREQLQAQLLVRILGFATEPRWHVPEPTPVAELNDRWRDLEYVRWGWTNMGPAFEAVGEVLESDRLETRALRPAILLVTDGLPTDPPGGFERGLAALTRHTAGRLSLRLAVAIGR